MNTGEREGADNPAAQALLRLMEQISEDHWAAGWLTDLESRLWRLAQGDRARIEPAWPSSAEDGAELRRLSELCQSWWVWDDATIYVKLVPLEEWQARV